MWKARWTSFIADVEDEIHSIGKDCLASSTVSASAIQSRAFLPGLAGSEDGGALPEEDRSQHRLRPHPWSEPRLAKVGRPGRLGRLDLANVREQMFPENLLRWKRKQAT